jgi:SAM-dependent methyltransferase
VESNLAERRRWNNDLWATAWPKRERLTDAVTPLVLDAAALQPGEAVLEVGSGGGKLAIAAAANVGPTGSVVGADISAPLVALANERAKEIPNVSFVVADMQDGRVAAEFDVAMSQFGVMFFDEPATAFANIRAHLRPGGRLVFACWQPLDRNPWFAGPALVPFVAPPAPPEPGKSPTGPFTLGDSAHVESVLTRAGFTSVARTTHDVVATTTLDGVMDDAQLTIIGIAPSDMAAARRAVDRYLSRFRNDAGGYDFPLAFQIFVATFVAT